MAPLVAAQAGALARALLRIARVAGIGSGIARRHLARQRA